MKRGDRLVNWLADTFSVISFIVKYDRASCEFGGPQFARYCEGPRVHCHGLLEGL